MDVGNYVQSLFSQTRKIDKRDESTVRRSTMDDGMFDRMVDQASVFAAAVERVPELDVQGEGSNEYIPHWHDLMGDMFKSLFTGEEPGVLEPEQIKPSREVNRRVMSEVIASDDFHSARPVTKLAEIEAAFSTIGMADHLRDTLTNEMSDLANEAKDAEKNEQQIKRQEEKAEEIREQVREQGGQATEEQKDAIKDAAMRKGNARKRLANNMEKMGEMPMTRGAAEGIQAAAKQAKKDAKLIASIPGIGKGTTKQLSPDEALRLAQMFKDNPKLMKVAEMLGRILRDMRFKRARRITGGREEIVDVGLGNDLELVMTSEKMKLMDPLMELDFMRRFHERALLQYELQGTTEAGYGPLIICRDESSSMNGQRNIWAAAVCLALVSIARKENRDAAVVGYSSASQQQVWYFPHSEPFDPDKVIEMAGHQYSGGTDATPAIKDAVNITAGDVKYSKADLVLITDGEDNFGDDDKNLRDELKARGVRLHGVMVGSSPSQYLREMCETIVSAYDLAGANEATNMLAENIS